MPDFEKVELMLKNVRISFPHLFRRPVFRDGPGKFGGTLLLNKKEHAALIKKVDAEIKKLCKKSFGKDLAPDKVCMRDGDFSRDEYEGHMYLTTNSKGKPCVFAADGKSEIQNEDDCKIYAGCRVNAKIELWVQDSKDNGKRINGAMIAVQFAGDDETLDGSTIDPEKAAEGFEDVGDYDKADDSWMDDEIPF